MSLYSRARRHIDMDRVKQIHEQKKKQMQIAKEIAIEEKKYLLESLKKAKHYNWRDGICGVPEYSSLKEKCIISRLENIDKILDEGMTSKGFEYLYGLQISSVYAQGPHAIQSTLASDIVRASADVTDYSFGQYFPGSYVNSIGDTQINSYSKVDAVAFLDTTYGNAYSSGGGSVVSLNTGNDPFPPEGSGDIPGSVTSRGSLESALGISLPAGVPNGNLGGTPIEGSAVKRIFPGAKVGNRINFSWAFSSSEDALGPASVDDYAFVAIQGKTTKFVSVLTKGLVSTGQFLYTVQPSDIDANGNVTVSVGVMDVYDQYIRTNLTITNFGTLWQTGELGDTTDAADLGMSVDAANPNKKKKGDEIAQLYPADYDMERNTDLMLLKGLQRGDYGTGPEIDKQIKNIQKNLQQGTFGGLPKA